MCFHESVVVVFLFFLIVVGRIKVYLPIRLFCSSQDVANINPCVPRDKYRAVEAQSLRETDECRCKQNYVFVY